MVLKQAWVLWIVLALIALALVVGIVVALRAGGGRQISGAPLSRAERLRSLPSFRRAVQRRMLALTAIVVVGVAAMAVAGVIAARPQVAQTIQPENTSRDVMLCLDVSGSMADVDVEVLSIFEELTDGFEGERIGLMIFNSSSVQIFPLTDDYDFVREHLANIRKSFDYADVTPEHWVGTLNAPGASLIGDGLASCAMRFDHGDDDRARSIIFATDNEPNGTAIVTLEEAAQYAAERGIRVYSINPVDGKDADNTSELADAAALTGGEGFALRDTATVDAIIDEVHKQEASLMRGEAQVVRNDAPGLWIAALLTLIGGFVVLLWRVRL
ncbi:vWA domain-containing protein [Microbacterium sp. YY-01]|uniref:vWA domain-containing protein n=1 Tax=Microbacterium sp. YY-01 TaxID=3421634 RepID=UPI003D182DC0